MNQISIKNLSSLMIIYEKKVKLCIKKDAQYQLGGGKLYSM